MTSSGAIIPARAPASIDMLQIVMRPSIESASTARAGVLDHVALAAGDADLADRGQHHVLRREPERQLAGERDAHRLRQRLRQRLRRQHVLDLGRADAERERAERAVRRGVAVAADDRHPRLRQAELRPDHVHDPLAAAPGREQAHTELLAVRGERVELRPRELVGDRPVHRRDVVVHRRDRQLGPPNSAAVQAERLERLRARHLVHEMQVDVEQRRRAVLLGDEVRVPDLAKQRAHRSRSAAYDPNRRSSRVSSRSSRSAGPTCSS